MYFTFDFWPLTFWPFSFFIFITELLLILPYYHRATFSLGRHFYVALTFTIFSFDQLLDIECCDNEHRSFLSPSFTIFNFIERSFLNVSLCPLDFTLCIFEYIRDAIKTCYRSTPVSKVSISLFHVYIPYFSLSDDSLMLKVSAKNSIYELGPCTFHLKSVKP